MSLEFECDPKKASTNQAKHGVTFTEAATVFADSLAVIFDDPAHSDEESRELIVGHSNKNRLLIVSFTERDDALRIIRARKATKQERKDYEENCP